MTTPAETDIFDLIPPEAEIVRRIVQEVRRYPRIRQPLIRFLTADDFDELIALTRENSEGIRLILERLGVMDGRLTSVEGQLVSMDGRLTSVEGQLVSMDGRLTSVEGQLVSMDGRLTSVEGQLVSIDGRLTSVEGQLVSIDGRLTSVEGQLVSIDGRLTSVEGRLTSVEGQLVSMDGRLTSVEGRLTSVEGTVERIDSNVRSLQGAVGQLRGDSYEGKCTDEIEGILDGYLQNAVLADRARITIAFRNARGNNLITRDEFVEHYRPDIIARAAHDDGEAEALAVAEASITFNREDLEAASRRAGLIGRITGVPTAAYLVTHHEWPADMDDAARELGVTIIRYEIPEYAI